MTETELTTLRLECAALASEIVLKILVRATPDVSRRILPSPAEWVAESQGITFPNMCPAYAALHADEAREAVMALLERMAAW